MSATFMYQLFTEILVYFSISYRKNKLKDIQSNMLQIVIYIAFHMFLT